MARATEPSLDLPTGKLLFVAEDVYSAIEEPNLSPQRKQRAEECFRQAREHCENGEVGAALQWATRTVYLDPNHEAGRRVLGHRRVGAAWAGAYAARQLESGETWHASFGWIRPEDVARYEAGERRLGKIWISIEDDARRHATIKKGWQIRTDHFRVVTNHSRQEATRLATRLETLHQLWQQLFGGFYLEAPQLLKRFDGKETSGYRSKPFHVVYYGSRQEYNATLRRQQPRIGITLGIYFDTTRTSHFFAGPEQDPGTIAHEAVHQFFQESARSARDVGGGANAWILEGVACYFESLQEHQNPSAGRFFTLGTVEAGRLPAARHRRLIDDYYVPLAELSALGMTDLQRRPDIARLYSQSAGLATFLMHGQNGEYREALVKLLQLIYTGRDKPTSLQQLTGQDFAILDRQYREFLEALPPTVAEESAK
ncbi:MAG: DUF1570 domain-containing protein [Planctomycetes bacterium]|nr:DUF1570 domain-containing protein [Planctomycetota bacterium]